MTNVNGVRCATGKSDASNDHLTGPFVKKEKYVEDSNEPR